MSRPEWVEVGAPAVIIGGHYGTRERDARKVTIARVGKVFVTVEIPRGRGLTGTYTRRFNLDRGLDEAGVNGGSWRLAEPLDPEAIRLLEVTRVRNAGRAVARAADSFARIEVASQAAAEAAVALKLAVEGYLKAVGYEVAP